MENSIRNNVERRTEARVEATASTWPRISIITPSFNQAAFLERTLCSVLDQNYPNLEYIVIDGGSTDGSVDIIKRYEDRLAYWVSESDRGQSHALNKGFAMATGEIVGWLNSDDLYCPQALYRVAHAYLSSSEYDVWHGGIFIMADEMTVVDATWPMPADPKYTFWVGLDVHQMALFWKRELMYRIGQLDEGLHFAMDHDFILRLLLNGKFCRLRHHLGIFRIHEDAKTSTQQEVCNRDLAVIHQRYLSQFSPLRPVSLTRPILRIRRLARVVFDAPVSYFWLKLRCKLGWQVTKRP